MNELSYRDALDSGIEPSHYRSDILESLGKGRHPGVLDALVWAKRDPALMALITLTSGQKVRVFAFQRHSRKDLPPYLGLRELEPGAAIDLEIDIGIRGGLRPLVTRRADCSAPQAMLAPRDEDEWIDRIVQKHKRMAEEPAYREEIRSRTR